MFALAWSLDQFFKKSKCKWLVKGISVSIELFGEPKGYENAFKKNIFNISKVPKH